MDDWPAIFRGTDDFDIPMEIDLFLDPFASGCDWGATYPPFLGKPWD